MARESKDYPSGLITDVKLILKQILEIGNVPHGVTVPQQYSNFLDVLEKEI